MDARMDGRGESKRDIVRAFVAFGGFQKSSFRWMDGRTNGRLLARSFGLLTVSFDGDETKKKREAAAAAAAVALLMFTLTAFWQRRLPPRHGIATTTPPPPPEPLSDDPFGRSRRK